MLPFSVSIALLSLSQALLVAAPRPPRAEALAQLRSRWWALALPGPLALVVAAIALESAVAEGLSWLALLAVPPLAALALGGLVHGARPRLALLAVPLFALAWAFQDRVAGEASALALSALACVSLAWLLASVVPGRWLKAGIYAMAAIDAWLIAADMLQGPSAVLNSAAPGALPQLQYASLGSAAMGFGDLFVAAALGALLAANRRLQLLGALLTAALALSFDLLFLLADSLPATVPVALALLALDLRSRLVAGLRQAALSRKRRTAR